MNKLLPTILILGCVALLAFAFIIPVSKDTQLAAVSTQTNGFTLRQKSFEVEEGSLLKVTVVAPPNLTKTTRVAVQVQTGTASRSDVQTTTKYVTFYAGGLTSKTVSIKTNTDRTVEQPETFSLKIGGTSETASVTLYEKGTINTPGNRIVGNTNTDPYTGPKTTTGTGTSTPPANCEQYAGVLPAYARPGETRKLTLEHRSWQLLGIAPKPQNFQFSAEAQAQLNTMQGDLGHIFSFFDGTFYAQRELNLQSGKAYVWPIKTTEYNDVVRIAPDFTSIPETGIGNVLLTVTKCPGDFTNYEPHCMQMGPVDNTSGFEITSGNPGGFTCDLKPNSQYYLNITAGFSVPSTGPESTGFNGGSSVGIWGQYVGGSSTAPASWVNLSSLKVLASITNFDYRGRGPNARPANGAPGIVKGKDAYYLEVARGIQLGADAAQSRVQECRDKIRRGERC